MNSVEMRPPKAEFGPDGGGSVHHLRNNYNYPIAYTWELVRVDGKPDWMVLPAEVRAKPNGIIKTGKHAKFEVKTGSRPCRYELRVYVVPAPSPGHLPYFYQTPTLVMIIENLKTKPMNWEPGSWIRGYKKMSEMDIADFSQTLNTSAFFEESWGLAEADDRRTQRKRNVALEQAPSLFNRTLPMHFQHEDRFDSSFSKNKRFQ